MHTILRIVFVIGIAILFTLFVSIRPHAVRRPSRRSVVGLVCVGLIMGYVFLTTASSLMATTS